ncbi:IS110 family transposase [Egicoccus halophilus]|uniref:IS110 family transposase n=1 Tax=Egicoccus halophilus TaxID=1670830 RepID=UPI0010309C4B|nr:IS110 family transposase [Egicoccus halophilus]
MDALFVGHDWAEDHHDVHLQDREGRQLAQVRLADGVEGIARFHALIAEHAQDPASVVIATETDRGLFVAALVAAGYRVFAVNPVSTAAYRTRHSTSGAKSDPGDAKVLADLARTDVHNHRPVAGDSELAVAVKVLARAHQGLVWTRQRQANQLRSTLREFYPAALEAFDDLASGDALALLAVASTPEQGRRLSRSKIAAALRRGGRQRNIDRRTIEIQTALRAEHLHAPAIVADTMGEVVSSLVAVIATIQTQISQLEQQLNERFEAHPDAKIIRSLPGLGMILGARVLAEFGDDPNRYDTAKSRKNYAGTSPITKASGKHHVVLARYARNKRLADACYQWAFSAITASPGARAFYDQRRAAGDTHHRALRALGNRLVGILHGCLRHHTLYDEHIAWAHRLTLAA